MENFYKIIFKNCTLATIAVFLFSNQSYGCGTTFNNWGSISLSIVRGGSNTDDRSVIANNGPGNGNYSWNITGGHFIDDQGKSLGNFYSLGSQTSPRFIVDNVINSLPGCIYISVDISVPKSSIHSFTQAFYGNAQYNSGNLGFVTQNIPGYYNTNDPITASSSTTLSCDQGISLSVPYYQNTNYTWNIPGGVISSNWGQGVYVSRFAKSGTITAKVTMSPKSGYCTPSGNLTRSIILNVQNNLPNDFVVTGPNDLLESGQWITRIRNNSPIPVTCNTNLTLSAPYAANCTYSWSFPGAIISGATNTMNLNVTGFTSTGATRASCTITPNPGYCGIAVTGYTDYTVNGPTKANVSTISNLTSSITPNCSSNSYSISAPYYDGKSTYTFTIPSDQVSAGWTFSSYENSSFQTITNNPLTTVTVPENTTVTLKGPSILNTTAFNISGSINQACWGSQALPNITVNAYNPVPSDISLTGSASLCMSNFGNANFNVNNGISGGKYNWKLNSTYLESEIGVNLTNINVTAVTPGIIPNATNTIVAVINNIPCFDPTKVSFVSTTFNTSYSGDVTPNPATIDPTTGQTTICVESANTSNTYDWSSLTPYGFIINSSSANCATLARDYTKDPYGSSSPTSGQVITNNTICPNVPLTYSINPTQFSYAISPAFTTACVNSTVQLKVTLSGGRKPYGTGVWKTYDPNLQGLLSIQADGSVKISSTVAQNIGLYYSITDNNGNTAQGSGATINFTNSGGGNSNGGWASGQLVNTACATNDVLKSGNFVSEYDGSNAIHYINTNNVMHYYYFDRTSAYCSGSTSWVQDQGLEYFITNPPFNLSNNLPANGTPLAGGVYYNNNTAGYLFQLFYIGNNSSLYRINGDGSITNFNNAIIINVPGNFAFDGTNLYCADGTVLKKSSGDVTTAITNNIALSIIAYNVSGKYIAQNGNIIYYAGSDGSLNYVDVTKGTGSSTTGNPILTNSDIKVADGNIIYLKDKFNLAYYAPGSSSPTIISLSGTNGFPSGVWASGRIAAVSNVPGQSIFVSGTDGNLYQVIYTSGTGWHVVKATSTNINDNAQTGANSGYAVYNGSNILYTNASGNIWNLYGSCGNTLRVADPESTVIDNNPVKGTNLTCYPNPFNSTINFEVVTEDLSIVKIQVIDILGNLVQTINENSSNIGTRTFQLNGNQFSKGLYIVKLFKDGNFVAGHKIIYE